MKINADLVKRAVVDSNSIEWADSPSPGVYRKMLDRDGGEVARATSIVRYEPDSYFDYHVHAGGEEFLVLEGTFSDEMGDFPKGMYVRNPAGSRHKPHTKEGCIILVKLRQFDPDDQEYVRIDTYEAEWRSGSVSGVDVMLLHEYGNETVVLLRIQPGVRLDKHSHPGGEEIFVLEGALADEYGEYTQGTWLRNPAGSEHAVYSNEGCLLYIKTGHL